MGMYGQAGVGYGAGLSQITLSGSLGLGLPGPFIFLPGFGFGAATLSLTGAVSNSVGIGVFGRAAGTLSLSGSTRSFAGGGAELVFSGDSTNNRRQERGYIRVGYLHNVGQHPDSPPRPFGETPGAFERDGWGALLLEFGVYYTFRSE